MKTSLNTLARSSFFGSILALAFLLAIFLLAVPSFAWAQISEFGGSRVRYRGAGDLEPPECAFNVPVASTEPFSAVWNCIDSDSEPSEIRTELWIIRNGASRPVLLESFLGFPAGLSIDESTLGVTSFAQGLPFQLRLVATDRAGNAALSPVRTVSADGTSSSTCSLSIVTEGGESDETTTGTPSMTVSVSNAEIRSVATGSNALSITSSAATSTTICEIDSLCDDNEQIQFDSSLTFDGEAVTAGESSAESDANGTINIFPGGLAVALEGEGFFTEEANVGLNATGSTTINGAVAEVTISCSP